PEPNLPTGEDYGPPSPPSPCYLGPPPPTGNNILIIFRELLSSGYRCTSQVVFVSTLVGARVCEIKEGSLIDPSGRRPL
ncbi:hypothetical protein FRC03_005423, partial [Tulasnella sp. 419]